MPARPVAAPAARRRVDPPHARRDAARGEIHDDVLASHVITIPEVRMSPDLQARDRLCDAARRQGRGPVLEALTRSKRYIRGEIAQAVNLRSRARCSLPRGRDFEEADPHRPLLLDSPKVAGYPQAGH